MSIEVVDAPFVAVEKFVQDHAKSASGFIVVAFFPNKDPEYGQVQDGTVSLDTMIATLEKMKTRMVMSEIAEFEIVDDEETL